MLWFASEPSLSPICYPTGFIFIAAGCGGGGAGRILLPAAELASLCLEEAVAGSNVIMVLRDHGHVQFFLRVVARCSSSFRRVGGLCPVLFLTMSFAGLVAFARIRTLFLLLGVLPSRKAALESWMVSLYAGSPA